MTKSDGHDLSFWFFFVNEKVNNGWYKLLGHLRNASLLQPMEMVSNKRQDTCNLGVLEDIQIHKVSLEIFVDTPGELVSLRFMQKATSFIRA